MGLSKTINLTVKGYSVTLSDSIGFYKNDALKLKFNINQYGIDVDTHQRALMPINPLLAHLRIDSPDGTEEIESLRIIDNHVEFYLSEKYTQHIGKSQMQLRLSDSDGCKITLPAFEFEIRESMYDSDDQVIHAVSTLVDENKVEVVDENNNPIKVAATGLPKEIKDFDLQANLYGDEDLLIQDSSGITKRIKSSAFDDRYAAKSEVDDLKGSVGDGKARLAQAITDMGVETSSKASFDEMASNILEIGALDEKLLSLNYSFENNLMGSGAGIISLKRRHEKYAGVYKIYWADESNAIYSPYDGQITEFDLTDVDHLTKSMNACYAIPRGVKKLIAVRNNEIEALYNIPTNKQISVEKKYSYGLLSDIHISGGQDRAESVSDFHRAMNYFKQDNVDMLIVSGDVTALGLMSDMVKFRELVDYHQVPTYCCRGNHDTYNDCTIDNYKKYIDPNGLYYEMEHKGDVYLFLGLAMEDVANPFPDYGLDWLEERLEHYKNQRVFLIQHIFAGDTGNPGDLYMFNEGLLNSEGTNAKRFIELVKKYRNPIFFSGHSHFDFSLERLNPKANVAQRSEVMCHRVHTPSGSRPRQTDIDTPDNEDNVYTNYTGSQGYTVDVYDDFIILRGIDFETMKLPMNAQYFIDTRPIQYEASDNPEESQYPFLKATEFADLTQGSLNKDGTIKEHTSTRVSKLIRLNDNPSPMFKCNGRIIYMRVCYYDKNESFISYENYFYNDIASDYHEEFTINKPTNAEYMRFSAQERIDQIEFNGVFVEEAPQIPPKPPIIDVPDNAPIPKPTQRPEPTDKYEKAKWKCVNFIKNQLNVSNYSSVVEFKDITVENELIRPGVGTVIVTSKLCCGTVNSLDNPAIIHNKYISLDDLYDEQYLGVVSGKWHDSLKFPENYRVDVYVITDSVYYVDSCPLKADNTWATKRNALRGIKHIELVEKTSGLVVEYGRPVVDNYQVDLFIYEDVEYALDTCKIFVLNKEYYFFSRKNPDGKLLAKVVNIKGSVSGISAQYTNIKQGRLPSSYLVPENDPNFDKEGNSALGKHAYLMNSRSFIYDVGLALLVFVCESEYDLCRELINRMRFEQNEDGSFNFSYDNYIGQLYEDYVRTGSIGWIIWGICYYAIKTGDNQYNDILQEAGEWILNQQVLNPEDNRHGLLKGGRGAYDDDYSYINQQMEWCSTEHNCSTLQAIKGLYLVLKDERYNQCASLIQSNLISKLYDSENGRFYQGISQSGVDEAWAIDCLSWAGKTAHSVGRTDIANACADQIMNKFSLQNKTILVSSEKETFNLTYSSDESISGFKPYADGYDNPPQLIWSEGTLGVAALLKAVGRQEQAQLYIDEMIKLQNCNNSTGGVLYTTETRASLPYEFHTWESVVGCAWLYLTLIDEDVLFI